ncbi:mechanosensitive ion channel [Hyphomonas sp. WL0036]|uniref:mechanosensitive ion channel family protein n=1 Tax=Hyphomonas sediminis TaxID=2866160 RepID=UPI001C80A8C4|nr:mechanosensitive ion channel domain-containing protein [Hyphomonas sediminis]MBY9065487.1 mechanosensitive ion channel [Hyphomonas sediminis]
MSLDLLQPEAAAPLIAEIQESITRLIEAARHELSSPDTLWQLGALALCSALGYLLSRFPKKKLMEAAEKRGRIDFVLLAYHSLSRIVWPVLTVILLGAATAGFEALGVGNNTLHITTSLLLAWILVRIFAASMRRGFWSKVIAYFAWALTALYIVGWLRPFTRWLNTLLIDFGDHEVSVLRILISIALAWFALWLGRLIGNVAQSQLRGSPDLPASVGGLLGQSIKIGVMIVAALFALNFLGVNVTALTFFSGALGVGIGFGLQSVFSNFMSGVIILAEKSLKVGDFIELQSGLSGVVKEINFRSTLVMTNDNVDIIVPNEAFIKAQLINWTMTEARRRIHVPFGVAYDTDKERVQKAGLEAAAAVPWTFDDRGDHTPQVWLVKFGEFRLEFELIVWLTDEAVLRPQKVMADYVWAVHSALQKHEIHVSMPQRDLHIKSPETLSVRIEGGDLKA